MADEFASLKISIDASLKDFSAKMGDFEKILKGTEEQTKKTGGGFGQMAAGMLTAEAAMAAFKKSVDFVKEAVMGFDDDLMTTLRLTKEFGKEGAAQFEKYAETVVKGTRFSQDEIKLAGQKLTINKLNRDEIQKLLPVIMDYATKSGRDVTSTAEAFGRAVQYGTTRGLRPFGIEVDKSGSQLEIFNQILKAGTIPGVQDLAKEAGSIGAGGLIEMQNQLAEIRDSLGEKLLPVFQEVVKWMKDDLVPIAENLIKNFKDVAGTAKIVGEALLTYFAASKLATMSTSIFGLTKATGALNLALLANPVSAAIGISAVVALGLKSAYDALGDAQKEYDEAVEKYGDGTKPSGRGIQFKEDIKLMRETVKELSVVADEEAAYIDEKDSGYIKAHARAEELRKTLAALNVEYDHGSKSIKIYGETLAVSEEKTIATGEGKKRKFEVIKGGLILGKEKEFAEMEKALPSAPLSETEQSKLKDKTAADTKEMLRVEAEAWKNFKDLAGEALKTYQQQIELTVKGVDSAFAEHRITIDDWYKQSQEQLVKGSTEEIRVLKELQSKTKDVTEQKKYEQEIIQAGLALKLKENELDAEHIKKLREQERAQAQVNSILAASSAAAKKSKSGVGRLDPIADLRMQQASERDAIQSDYEKKLADATKYYATEEEKAQLLADTKKILRDKELADEKAIADAKIAIASQTANALASTFQNLYEMTGGKSKEMFALWQAAAVAEAIVNTYSSATAAFKSLAGIPVVGPVLGGIAAAAAITSGLANVRKIGQTKMQKMAEGGYIGGRSHNEGGINYELEGGEFIQRKTAVSKYGIRAMNAINQGLANPSAISAATSSRAGAGAAAMPSPAAGSNKFTIVNFLDAGAFKRFLATPAGKTAIQNHISENSFNIKQALGTA